MHSRDDAAFSRFVAAQGQGLLRVAFLMTGDAARAEDLTQTVLARALPQWQRIEAAGHPLAYLRRALLNERTDTWRRQGRRELLVHDVPDLPSGDHAAAVGRQRDVIRALQSLPAGQRAVVVLRYLEDLPDDEIAAALSCEPGTVRSQAKRGLAKLRLALGEELTVDEGCVPS
jgi:RNA polymerase sigma-70 factor (sigma-E family)